jgi:hypothetical protein
MFRRTGAFLPLALQLASRRREVIFVQSLVSLPIHLQYYAFAQGSDNTFLISRRKFNFVADREVQQKMTGRLPAVILARSNVFTESRAWQ